MSEPTEFYAIVAKIQTMADNGLRVTLDLPEQAIEQVAELMIYKRAGVVLDVAITPRPERENDENAGKSSKPKL